MYRKLGITSIHYLLCLWQDISDLYKKIQNYNPYQTYFKISSINGTLMWVFSGLVIKMECKQSTGSKSTGSTISQNPSGRNYFITVLQESVFPLFSSCYLSDNWITVHKGTLFTSQIVSGPTQRNFHKNVLLQIYKTFTYTTFNIPVTSK